MMAPAKDALLGLELRRLQLEEQVSKLRKSLRHWQTWDAEYEGLKEELGNLSDNSSREDILKSGQDLGGTFINPEEVKSLLGPASLNRTKTQIIGLLSRRIDYVQQNAQTVEKQLNAAEDKLNSLLVVQHPEATTEDELPLTEIVEELDEDGEVTSGTTRTPGDAETELLETLQRAGVKKLPTQSDSGPGATRVNQLTSRTTDVGSNDDEEGRLRAFTQSTQSTSSAKLPARDNHVDARSTSSGSTSKPTYSSSSQSRALPSRPFKENDSLPWRGRVEDLESSDEDSHDDGPEEEEDYDDPGVGGLKDTPEEARQRREMLQYSNGLSEVGAIVAELEIDEEGIDDEAIDLPLEPNYDFDDIDLMFSSGDSDEEDEHGRSTFRMVDEEYRQKMQDLEEKLKLRGTQNLGPEPEGLSDDLTTVEAYNPANADSTVILTAGEPRNSRKKVSFADDIDVAPSHQKPSINKSVYPPNERISPPLKELVIERQPQSSSSKQPPSNPSRKPSRFKSVRNVTASNRQDGTILNSFAEGPTETHSQTVVERQPTSCEPKSPDMDELDEDLHKQEITNEYYDKRNNMIQRQGGFISNMNEENKVMVPLPKEDGGPGKMSRFKAARLK